jgi:hypothetical protein
MLRCADCRKRQPWSPASFILPLAAMHALENEALLAIGLVRKATS